MNGEPDDVVSGAASVEVTERIGQPTGYRIGYNLDIVDGDLPLLAEDKLGADSELSIFVPAGDATYCLVKGPVYGQEIHLAHGGAGSMLQVLGADSLIKMDREDKVVAWADVTDSDAVRALLGQFGFVPDVEDTKAGHFELKHTLIQRETDLAFIRRLARRNGFHFWITVDESGAETAHFKRPVLEGEAACDLVINLRDPKPNVGALDICWDVQRPVKAKAAELDLNNKSDITGDVEKSPLAPLGSRTLSEITANPGIVHVRAPVDDSGDLQARSEGALIEAGFFVRATGATTLSALGTVVRAHTLVHLRGAGSRHSGLWYCSAVRHIIDSSEHRMEFELIRNAWKE